MESLQMKKWPHYLWCTPHFMYCPPIYKAMPKTWSYITHLFHYCVQSQLCQDGWTQTNDACSPQINEMLQIHLHPQFPGGIIWERLGNMKTILSDRAIGFPFFHGKSNLNVQIHLSYLQLSDKMSSVEKNLKSNQSLAIYYSKSSTKVVVFVINYI